MTRYMISQLAGAGRAASRGVQEDCRTGGRARVARIPSVPARQHAVAHASSHPEASPRVGDAGAVAGADALGARGRRGRWGRLRRR